MFHGEAANPPGESDIKIISIEQHKEGLIIVVSEESNGQTITDKPLYELPSLPVTIEAPSIAVINVINFRLDQLIDREMGNYLWLDGIYKNIGPIEAYAPDLFNEWINVLGFGEINIQNYPWVHIKKYGWFWIMEGEPWEGLATYWAVSSDLGWLWTSRATFPTVWSQRFGSWVTLVKDFR